MKIKKLGLIFKTENIDAKNFAVELLEFLTKMKYTVLLPRELASILGRDEIGVESIEAEDLDALVVIGGDGTLLKTFHMIKRELPIIPVNSDTLGFFYDINRDNYRKAFDLIARGRYEIKTWRTGLIKFGNENHLNFLNEAVLYCKKRGKMLIFELRKGDIIVIKGRCDGIIMATTLGSTAYSLSQGGPIVDWELEALIFTPISPFSPIVKPIVFSSSTKLDLELYTESTLVIDGEYLTNIEKKAIFEVSLEGKPFRLVKVREIEADFFDKIRRRLFDEVFYSKFF
ncbi:MAG: hypothetical protein DRJ38_01125 [Thermoprotei archaeon]|nr:MAG: hypothetical protein DRJ38_01125 [Thermoprotei archaeon]